MAPKITGISMYTLSGRGSGAWQGREQGIPGRPRDAGERQGRHTGLTGERRVWVGKTTISRTFLEVHTNTGLSGIYGPVTETIWPVVRGRIEPVLAGRDPRGAGELAEELSAAVGGVPRQQGRRALSAVDNALWDLRGKLSGKPVHALLGDTARERVSAYASLLGYSHRPDLVRERARRFVDSGFAAQKWFFSRGGIHGDEGIEANRDLVRTVRETVGERTGIMFDCWNSGDAAWACRLTGEIEPFGPLWLEEPVPPDDLEAYRRVREAGAVPLAGGENLLSSEDLGVFLDAGVLDFVQCDPDWCGGITEMMRVCRLAADHGVKVVPHGCNLTAALHIAASQPETLCPMVEYLVIHMQRQNWFLSPVPTVDNGCVRVPAVPGLGIVIDRDKVESSVPVSGYPEGVEA